MNNVKTIKKDGYTLTHSWYVDDFGLKRNTFDLFNEAKRVHYPFHGMIRVNTYDPSGQIEGDDVSPYTDEQYQEMFNEQLAKEKV